MRIRDRTLLSTALISLLFFLVFSALVILYAQVVSTTHQLVEESAPTLETLEHLIITIYTDNLLVQEYLLLEDYEQALAYDDLLSDSAESCAEIAEDVEDMILLEKISDEQTIRTYRASMVLYNSLDNARANLLRLHKQELATNVDLSANISSEQARYHLLLQNTSSYLAESITSVSKKNIEVQQELTRKSVLYGKMLISTFLLFMLVSVLSGILLYRTLARPIDDMISTSRKFTSGTYDARVKNKTKIKELQNLQEQMNLVFSTVEKTIKEEKKTKKPSKMQDLLLAPQYMDIIDFIKSQAEQQRSVSIKDLKKQLNLTHPTIQARLQYLVDKEYIILQKHGRQKLIKLNE